jgi:hypothetical protein
MTAALNTRRKKVMVKVLKVLQNLVMCDINKGDGAGGLIGQVRGPLHHRVHRIPGRADNSKGGDAVNRRGMFRWHIQKLSV